MPPRNPELPEGTDHVVNGAMDTGAGGPAGSTPLGGTAGAGTGIGATGGLAGGSGGLGGSSPGFIGGGDTGGFGDDTGGTATASGGTTGGLASTGTGGGLGGSSGGGQGGTQGVKQQLRDSAQSVKSQATDRARSYAVDGKDRAAGALDEFAQVMTEAAQSIDERLGAQYGEYARRAADSVTDFSNRLRDKELDELLDDARSFVRKSPAVAIGTAAAVGFALVRLIKAGVDDSGQSGRRSAGGTSGSFETTGATGGSSETTGTTGGNFPQAPSVGGPTAGA